MKHLTATESDILDLTIVLDLLLWIIADPDYRKPFTSIHPAMWDHYGGWLLKQNLISQKRTWDGAEEVMEYKLTEGGEIYLQRLHDIPVPKCVMQETWV